MATSRSRSRSPSSRVVSRLTSPIASSSAGHPVHGRAQLARLARHRLLRPRGVEPPAAGPHDRRLHDRGVGARRQRERPVGVVGERARTRRQRGQRDHQRAAVRVGLDVPADDPHRERRAARRQLDRVADLRVQRLEQPAAAVICPGHRMPQPSGTTHRSASSGPIDRRPGPRRQSQRRWAASRPRARPARLGRPRRPTRPAVRLPLSTPTASPTSHGCARSARSAISRTIVASNTSAQAPIIAASRGAGVRRGPARCASASLTPSADDDREPQPAAQRREARGSSGRDVTAEREHRHRRAAASAPGREGGRGNHGRRRRPSAASAFAAPGAPAVIPMTVIFSSSCRCERRAEHQPGQHSDRHERGEGATSSAIHLPRRGANGTQRRDLAALGDDPPADRGREHERGAERREQRPWRPSSGIAPLHAAHDVLPPLARTARRTPTPPHRPARARQSGVPAAAGATHAPTPPPARARAPTSSPTPPVKRPT